MNNKGIIALLLIKVCKVHSSHVQLVLTLRLCILDKELFPQSLAVAKLVRDMGAFVREFEFKFPV